MGLININDIKSHPYFAIACNGLSELQRENAAMLAMLLIDCPVAAMGALNEEKYQAVIGPASSLASRIKNGTVA